MQLCSQPVTGALQGGSVSSSPTDVRPRPALQLQHPVLAAEWSCHAATTIMDAAGQVLAECGGHGRHSDEDVLIAAEIARRVNAHQELLSLVVRGEKWLSEVEATAIAAGRRREHSLFVLDMRSAIARATATGGAA